MAQTPEPDDQRGLFERDHKEKRIARILEAATRKRVREAEKAKPLRTIKPLVRGSEDFGRVRSKALGANIKGKKKASVRAKGADGARSFHFEAYYTSRDDAAREAYKSKHRESSTRLKEWAASNNVTPHGTGGAGSRGGSPSPDAPRTRSSGGRGSSAAHLAYIEREGAVERVDLERELARELGLEETLDAKAPARGRGRPTKEQQAEQAAHAAARMEALEQIAAALRELHERALDEPAQDAAQTSKIKRARERASGQDRDEGRERDPFERDTAGRGQAAAAQAYMENPQKLKNGEISLSSFGNIGDTFEERRTFWDLLEEHETVAAARVQNRLIMELPHQATPEARAQIMRDFAQVFDDLGLPYHVAIHAPGPQNDDRNFHAHIVFSERPAKTMIDPATGELAWDFAITTTIVKKSRNKLTSHPHRQPRNRDVKEKRFIPSLRKHYADCVNAVMKDVGRSVKFDPRSYKDMGISTDPIETVSRITNDRLLSGGLVIQDAAWTKRMVEAELAKAVLAREKDVAALIETTKRLEKLKTAWPSVNKINAEVGPFSKMLGIGRFTKRTYLNLVNQRLAYENLRLQERVVTRAEASVVRDVLDATSRKRREAMGSDRQPAFSTEEREAMAAIHEAATAEMAGIKERSLAERRRLNGFVLRNKLAWKATGQMMMPPPSARPIPKHVETPDPKTGKIPFLAGAAADALAPARKPAPSRDGSRPKAAPGAPGGGQAKTSAAAPDAATRPDARPAAGAGASAKPKAAPGATQAPPPQARPARPAAARIDRMEATRRAGDPAGMRAAHDEIARRRAEAEQAASKAAREKEANRKFAEAMIADVGRRMAQMAKSMFGDLKGMELGAAVRKFNQDLGEEHKRLDPQAQAARVRDLTDLTTFMTTGRWPVRPENGPQPATSQAAPGKEAASPAAAKPEAGQTRPEPVAPEASAQHAARPTPAAEARQDAPRAAEPFATAAPRGADGLTPDPASRAPARTPERPVTPTRLEDVPINIPNIFDHLPVVETGPSRKTGGVPGSATPTPGRAQAHAASTSDHATPAVHSASGGGTTRDVPAPKVAADAATIGATPAPGTSARENTVRRNTVRSPRPRIIEEGKLGGMLNPTMAARGAETADSESNSIDVNAAGQEPGPVVEEPPVDVDEAAAAAVAAKRKKAAKRAGFVKRGKTGRAR